jgi:hypothetical protein
MVDALKDTEYGNFRENMLEQAERMGLATGDALTKVLTQDFIEEFKSIDWGDVFKDSFEKFVNLKTGAEGKEVTGQENEDFILRSSGEITSFTSEDDIIGAKKGGPLDKLMDKGLPSSSSMN